MYFANLSIGTPAQALRLHIDTGSSDLWVNTPNSSYCKSRRSPCAAAGTYNANSSSTYSYVDSSFNISYVDGSGASGDYVTDNLVISSATIKSLQFGIGYKSDSSEGVLGVGYQVNEVQAGLSGTTYANLPAKMAADGLIASNAYSLWLNDLDSSTGNILFGGVDTEQFHGTLATLPVEPVGNSYSEFLITLTSISLAGTAIASNQKVAILLDSGTSLTYLPNAITSAIYQAVGAQYDSNQGAAYVSCSLAQNTSTLDYTFTSATISVSMDELVISLTDNNGQPYTFSDGTPACIFGISPAGSSTAVLGDTFLRSAYVVYDLSNNQISIAQTRFNTTTSNILEIGTGPNAVPSATAVSNPVSASGAAGRGSSTGTVANAAASTATAVAVQNAAVDLGAAAAVVGAMLFAAI